MSSFDDWVDIAGNGAKVVAAASAGIATAAAPTGLYGAAVAIGLVSGPVTVTIATAVGGVAATAVAASAGYRLYKGLRKKWATNAVEG